MKRPILAIGVIVLLAAAAILLMAPSNTEFVWANVLASNTFTQTNTFQQGIVIGTQTLNAASLTQVKCANIDPAATTTDWFIYEFEAASTITHVRCWVDAATSVALTVQECDSDGASCTDTEAAMTCATTRTSESGAIDNAAIDAGDTLRVTRGAVSGSPTQAFVCVSFTTP